MAVAAERRTDIDQLCINTIRTLSIDAIQKANSGHPGSPMALAPLAYVIWQRFLRFDPQQPIWPNRDRFVLSNGHASMLLYSMLYLTGVRAVDPDYEVVGEPVGQPRRHQALPPARLEVPRPPRVPLDLRCREPRPARSARESRRASGWPSPRSGSPPATTPRASRSSTSTSTPSAATATWRRGSPTRPPRSPATSSSTTSAGSTTTTTSRSTGPPSSPTRTTSPPASPATAGT